MKYQWFENKTCTELSQELGCEVLSIVRGEIVIGEENGEPITRRGVEIEFKEKLTPVQLARIDSMIPNCKRKEDINPIPIG